jgi:hypothetical protein
MRSTVQSAAEHVTALAAGTSFARTMDPVEGRRSRIRVTIIAIVSRIFPVDRCVELGYTQAAKREGCRNVRRDVVGNQGFCQDLAMAPTLILTSI